MRSQAEPGNEYEGLLHTPLAAADGYAAGWMVTEWEGDGGTVLTHAGANPMNCCVIWLAPEQKFAVMVATNIGPDRAAQPSKISGSN